MTRVGALALAALALAACGARTGLEVPDGATPVDAPRCVPAEPPVERCNGRDDDCDGLVDEGLAYQPIGVPHALRTTEGDTGAEPRCSSCRWAWEPSIVPTASGMLVPFRLGIYGGSEQPSLFSRATDADGAAVGAVQRTGASVPLHLRRWDAPGPDGATWIDARFRVGTDDLAGWVIVDAAGSIRTIAQPSANIRSPGVALGGSVIVGTAAGVNVRAEQNRIRGDEVLTTSRRVLIPGIEAGGITSLGLAATPAGDGAVLFVARFVATPRSFRLWAQRLGAQGEPLGAPVLVVDAGAALTFFAATTDGGYLIFDPGNGTEATTRFVGASLPPAGAPAAIVPGGIGFPSNFDYLRMPEGGWLVRTGESLVRLDGRGRPVARWSGRLTYDFANQAVTTPDLGRSGGRTFITWNNLSPDATPNSVWIRELGCLREP